MVCTRNIRYILGIQDLASLEAVREETANDSEKEREMELMRREETNLKTGGRKDQRKHLEPTLTWIQDDKR